jgi:hypothetical protein
MMSSKFRARRQLNVLTSKSEKAHILDCGLNLVHLCAVKRRVALSDCLDDGLSDKFSAFSRYSWIHFRDVSIILLRAASVRAWESCRGVSPHFLLPSLMGIILTNRNLVITAEDMPTEIACFSALRIPILLSSGRTLMSYLSDRAMRMPLQLLQPTDAGASYSKDGTLVYPPGLPLGNPTARQ